MVTMAWTIARSSGSCKMSFTKERSIFSEVTGKRFR